MGTLEYIPLGTAVKYQSLVYNEQTDEYIRKSRTGYILAVLVHLADYSKKSGERVSYKVSRRKFDPFGWEEAPAKLVEII